MDLHSSLHFYIWVFSLIPLINLSVFMAIPCAFYYYSSVVKLEIRDGDASRITFIVQDFYSYVRFVFPYETEYYSSKVCKELLEFL